MDNIIARVKNVIVEYAELDTENDAFDTQDDLFAKGMSSRASVGVMLGLESEFDIEFPDEMLRRDVFESIASISEAVSSLVQE